MSLDLTKVAAQVGGMIARLVAGGEMKQAHLRCALNVLHNQATDLGSLKKKIASSRTTWLVADLVDGLDQHYEMPSIPAEFTVVATDGSHIDVDRHRSARCYLVNIGSALFHYGVSPGATLDSFPHLYFEDEDLVITPVRGREQLVEGTLLGIKRGTDECGQLAKLAVESSSYSLTLALLDGSLILWGLEAYPEFVTETLLIKGFLRHLDVLKKSSGGGKLALASYISFPRSTDVVNALRVALCSYDPVDCDRCCSVAGSKDCEAVSGVRDRELFSSVLGQGERSAVFITQSSIVRKHYRDHQVYFFYLKVDDEIARVEIPKWVATDRELLNLVHALIVDQCRRGQGYPVVLSEAHEQAVVANADRENFWQLVESSLVDEHLPSLQSAKSRSKRARWV